MRENTIGVILAAGLGTRMKSDTIKILHEVCGNPMLEYVLRDAEALCNEVVIVVGHQAEDVQRIFGTRAKYVLQKEQLGTGHALMQAGELLTGYRGDLLVLCGDIPLVIPEHLEPLLDFHHKSDACATVLVTRLIDPTGYGRILRGDDGRIRGIIEQKDASPEQLGINEINTGIYCFDSQKVFEVLQQVTPDNAQREYYLTDAIRILIENGEKVLAVDCPDPLAVTGVNDRQQLASVESTLRQRIRERHMQNGVTMLQPSTTFIDEDVQIGKDSVIYPFTFVLGKSIIGERCTVGQNTMLKDSVLENDVKIMYSVIESSRVCAGSVVGPFSHLRPDTVLGRGVKVGNFAEVKNSLIGDGCKVGHHSYIGDTRMGKRVNIGAGTVVVNYDGIKKHETIIGDDAFIGCNSNLIAPLEVGASAFIAAGSTIDKVIPEGALSIERSQQCNIEKWVYRRKARDHSHRPEGGSSEGNH